MSDKTKDISDRYSKWENLVYKAAIRTIGRTTFKEKSVQKPSEEIKQLRKERREYKTEFEKEVSPSKKKEKLQVYINKQKEIHEKSNQEEIERVKLRFEKMTKEANNGGFWRERKALRRDETSSWLVTKDKEGKRILDQNENKENIASYFEDLYSIKPCEYHPYHDIVKETVKRLSSETTSNANINDMMPTRENIRKAIENKKNKKATTDWKNEIIKRGGELMVDMITSVIEAFWSEEKPPRQWNEGVTTYIWKKKGDREKMENQRGITVSSAIGTIAEEIINNRLLNTIAFTQAQAGGKRGASTADHIFILRNLISIAKKEERNDTHLFRCPKSIR